MPLLYLSIAWLAGTFTGSFIALPIWVLAAAPLFFIPAIFLRNHRRALVISGLCLLLLLGGALRYQSSIQMADNTSLQFYNDKGMVQVDGSIS
ncbi:MAG: hypothetical protein NTZ34_00140, partial [Chloroflexi bacterium]|nr:hypothetical protein [Chloroflexota bacterium]